MFLLLVSVTFYRRIDQALFLPVFSTFVEILLQSCRKITTGICLSALNCINFLIHVGFKMWGFSGDISCLRLLHFITLFIHNRTKNYTKAQLLKTC